MEINLPTDCGNAPRIGIVGDFAVNWATRNADPVSEWLAEDARWTLAGKGTHNVSQEAREVFPPFSPELVEIISVITHGRLASCDGYLESGDRRIDFSHAIRFASTSKSAKIAELRSYCIETQAAGTSAD